MGSEFLALLFLCAELLLSLSSCLYPNPWVFQLLPFCFSPHPAGGGVSEWLGEAELLTGVKPQEKFWAPSVGQRVQGNDRSYWNVLDRIHSCYCCSTTNGQLLCLPWGSLAWLWESGAREGLIFSFTSCCNDLQWTPNLGPLTGILWSTVEVVSYTEYRRCQEYLLQIEFINKLRHVYVCTNKFGWCPEKSELLERIKGPLSVMVALWDK